MNWFPWCIPLLLFPSEKSLKCLLLPCACGLGRILFCSVVLVTRFLAVQNWFRLGLWSLLQTAKYRINTELLSRVMTKEPFV